MCVSILDEDLDRVLLSNIVYQVNINKISLSDKSTVQYKPL